MSEAIVLVPGLMCSAEVFDHQIKALWPLGAVTVASTLHGVTVEEIAASILRSAPAHFSLAGISFGGYLCLEILRQAPERVKRLALLDTSARPDTPEQSAQRRALIAQAQAREKDFHAWAEEALTSIMHPSRHSDANLRAINRRMGAAVGFEGFVRQSEAAIRRPDSLETLSAISVETLVIVGEQDKLIPREHSEEIVSATPGSQLVVISECGHASTLEQPALVSSALVSWMSSPALRGQRR